MKGKFGVIPLLLAAILNAVPQWTPAQPGYRFSLPRDHFSHPGYQTEWWYYTGNLTASDGHRFGYELTFFRQGNRLPPDLESTAIWKPHQIYLAHLALSDIDGHRFFHTQRLNRAGPGLAGASQHDSRYWNGNWEVRWLHPGINGEARLEAVCDELRLQLDLTPRKPAVVNGQDGISRKGPEPGEASHYISFTRMAAQGSLVWEGKRYAVAGLTWMDHEFFSEPPDNGLIGWDWFSIQLQNNTEVMLYRLRRNDRRAPAFSSGTFVDQKGIAHFLDGSQFTLTPGDKWHSNATNADYPVAWHITIPSLRLDLSQTTELKNQELSGQSSITPAYWEGAVNYRGTMEGKPVSGVGYLEMTGYGARMRLGSTD